MYLDRDAVHDLLEAMPPAAVLFDLVSKRLAAHSAKPRKSGYRAPAVDVRRRPAGARRAAGATTCGASRSRTAAAPSPASSSRSLNRVLNPIGVYSARTIAASSSSTTTPATTSTAASSANAASAARDATRATRRDA